MRNFNIYYNYVPLPRDVRCTTLAYFTCVSIRSAYRHSLRLLLTIGGNARSPVHRCIENKLLFNITLSTYIIQWQGKGEIVVLLQGKGQVYSNNFYPKNFLCMYV